MKYSCSQLSPVALLFIFALLLSSCAKEEVSPAGTEADQELAEFHEMMDALEAEMIQYDERASNAQNLRFQFNITRRAVQEAGLVSALVNQDITLFYPSDYAWNEIGINLNNVAGVPNLADVLQYHVVPGTLLAADLVEGPLTTALGEDIVIELDEPRPEINNRSDIYITDVARFGITIHVIDEVLNPANAPGQGGGGDPTCGPGYIQVPPASLPQSVQTVIATQFSGQSVVTACMDDDGYDIFLNNGVELVFDLAGNLLFVDPN